MFDLYYILLLRHEFSFFSPKIRNYARNAPKTRVVSEYCIIQRENILKRPISARYNTLIIVIIKNNNIFIIIAIKYTNRATTISVIITDIDLTVNTFIIMIVWYLTTKPMIL